jgi:hypothetical protein
MRILIQPPNHSEGGQAELGREIGRAIELLRRAYIYLPMAAGQWDTTATCLPRSSCAADRMAIARCTRSKRQASGRQYKFRGRTRPSSDRASVAIRKRKRFASMSGVSSERYWRPLRDSNPRPQD